jgi:benzylsuccinate CoA-transferase BbsF subunit
MHFLSPAILEFVANGHVQGPQGNRDPHMAPHGVYPCVADDSWIAIACATEEQWRTLSDLMGLSLSSRAIHDLRRSTHGS